MERKSVKVISSQEDLLNKIKNPNLQKNDVVYHYTSLECLYQILKNKTLKFSSMEKMNDVFERRLFGNCKDFFFCLSKGASKENFGMWAMYGHLKDFSDNEPEHIGVKIQFSKKVLEKICSKDDLEFHSVAYAELRESNAEGAKLNFTIGTQTTTSPIELEKSKMEGYLKDFAWSYENEIRLRFRRNCENCDVMEDEKFIDISEVIDDLIVYPSPYYSVEDCNKILKEKFGFEFKNFRENIYKNTFQNGEKK